MGNKKGEKIERLRQEYKERSELLGLTKTEQPAGSFPRELLASQIWSVNGSAGPNRNRQSDNPESK